MRKRYLVCLFLLTSVALAADAPPKAPITPGQVNVPTDRMRRLWGELVSIDPKTRTGTMRAEYNDEIMPFTIMPYSELLHHATNGDVQDFRIGERALFRLHPNDEGKWVWLTYIQDEMNFLANHNAYYWVDRIDPASGVIECEMNSADKSHEGEKGIVLETDAETRYWKDGKPASLADIHVGDKLRAKTHGVGKGKTRRSWELFLDDASLKNFQAEQKQVHHQRMESEGLPGYVDSREPGSVRLTLFHEGHEFFDGLKPGVAVRVAPAGVDRKPTAEPTSATVEKVASARRTLAVTLKLDKPVGDAFQPTGLARVWAPQPAPKE